MSTIFAIIHNTFTKGDFHLKEACKIQRNKKSGNDGIEDSYFHMLTARHNSVRKQYSEIDSKLLKTVCGGGILVSRGSRRKRLTCLVSDRPGVQARAVILFL